MLGHCGQTYLAYLGTWQEFGTLGGHPGWSWRRLGGIWRPLEGLGSVLKAEMSQDAILVALLGESWTHLGGSWERPGRL